MHALALHRLPGPHCASLVHATHLPAAHDWLALQSLSVLHPGVLDVSPQLATAKHIPRATSAARTAWPGADNERCMDWKLNFFGTLVNFCGVLASREMA